MALIYTVIIHLAYVFMLPAALFNKKIGLWVKGRRNWRSKLKQLQHDGSPTFWFHAASLGEFEQGLPIIEALRKEAPGCRILLTFFSPSGYEIRKNYKNADLVTYLPLDTAYNARTFIDLARPDAAFFIKYEFWHFYLEQLHRRNKPVFLISGIFRPGQVFFRWYGTWFRKQLRFFDHLFLQDASSAALLSSIGVSNTSITGDTRFDRVAANAQNAKDIPIVREFSANSICIVAGSSWPADESLLAGYINNTPSNVKFIIAPHEIDKTHINNLVRIIRKSCAIYSLSSPEQAAEKQVLVIDNIGMLSSVYRYGRIAYIGGGFGKGIHNILEAAVYGIPVIFGPNHEKFREAVELKTSGGGFSISSADELHAILNKLTTDGRYYQSAAEKARQYVQNNTGAVNRIMENLRNSLKFKV